MILYLDASALVKIYIEEPGSSQTQSLVEEAEVTGASMLARAEVAAGLARARVRSVLSQREAEKALNAFRRDWPDMVHIEVSEALMAQAEAMAWDHNLRGHDAVHLASAIIWQEILPASLTLATFDRELWKVTHAVGMNSWPKNLEEILG